MKKIKEIRIAGKDNGICVKVGCKELVYQQGQFKQFFKDLQDYFDDPEKAQERILRRYGIEGAPDGIEDIPQTDYLVIFKNNTICNSP